MLHAPEGLRVSAWRSVEAVGPTTDDHTRLACCEIDRDDHGDTCAGLIERAGQFFAGHGVTIERVITDDRWTSTKSHQPADGFLRRLSPTSAPHTNVSDPAARGRTARSNTSTRHSQPSRPTGRCSRPNDTRSAALPDSAPTASGDTTASKATHPISRLSPT